MLDVMVVLWSRVTVPELAEQVIVRVPVAGAEVPVVGVKVPVKL